MNPDQLDLARRLAAHPLFQWQRGMVALEDPATGHWQPGDYEWSIIEGAPDIRAVTSEGDIHESPYTPSAFARAVPDLTDAATGGVLLDMLIQSCGDGVGWFIKRSGAYTVTHAVEKSVKPGMAKSKKATGTTFAEACARALLAEWGES